MIKIVFFTLIAICNSQDVTALIKKHDELSHKFNEIEEVLHRIRDVTSETYLSNLSAQLTKLQEDMTKTESSLEILEKTTVEMTQGHKEFNHTHANLMISNVQKLFEKLEKVENRLKNLDFKHIHEQIEIGINGLITQDNQMKHSILKVKEQTEYLETILARESNFMWVYILIGFICLMSLVSWRMINKAEEREI